MNVFWEFMEEFMIIIACILIVITIILEITQIIIIFKCC